MIKPGTPEAIKFMEQSLGGTLTHFKAAWNEEAQGWAWMCAKTGWYLEGSDHHCFRSSAQA